MPRPRRRTSRSARRRRRRARRAGRPTRSARPSDPSSRRRSAISAAQPLAAQPEDREEIVDLVRADAAVAEQQLDAVASAGTPSRSSWSTYAASCMSAVTRAWRASFVSCTIHGRSARCGSRDEEVGEADEVVGRERGLVDDLRVRARAPRSSARPHRRGPRHPTISPRGSRPRRRRTARRSRRARGARARCRARPARSRVSVLGLFDRRDAPEPRVDRTQPRELALGRRLEVARAPDDPAFVLDVSHALPFLDDPSRGIRHVSALAHRSRSDPAARSAGMTGTCQTGTHEPALRERVPARVRARRGVHDPGRDRRPRRQRRGGARRGARVRCRRRRRRGLPRAVPHRATRSTTS